VGHHFVAGGFDGGDHVIDRGPGLCPATCSVFGSGFGRSLDLGFLGSFRLAVFGLFGHGILHLTNWNSTQAGTLKLGVPRLACTRSITNRNVSLASAVTGAARNIPIRPKSDAPSRVLKISRRGWTLVK